MTRMRGRVAALALLATCAVAGAAGLPARFDPSRDAAADVAHAVALARAQGKRVIVDVGGECANGALVHSQDTGELESGRGYDERRVLAFLCRASAQATCSRTSGEGSSARRRSASTIDASGAALPSATARLRDQRS